MKYEIQNSEPWLVKEELEDIRSRTKAYALRIIKLFGALPGDTVSQVLGKQVLRSGTSVGANYREASRSRSDADEVRQHGDGVVKRSETARASGEGKPWRVPFGRQGEQFVAKIGDCLKELDESAYWLELLVESETIPKNRLSNLIDETDQLLAIFTTISKNVKARPR